MKFIFLIFSTLIFFQNDWTLFSNEKGRFQIDSPGEFTEKVDSIETEIGKIAYHTFFYKMENEAGDDIFMVNYCDYNLDFEMSDSTEIIEDFFQATMEAAAESVNGEILYQNDIQLNNHAGKLWRINFEDGNAVAKTKAYLVDNRYYGVQVISLHNKSAYDLVDRFFNSFKLL